MKVEKLAVFDIDGTLHKTEVMSVAAYRVVTAEYGLPEPDRKTLFSTYGANTETIMRKLGVVGDKAYVDGFAKRIEIEENKQMQLLGECYAGVAESLKRLASDGVELGVCSMCSLDYMNIFLAHFGFNDIVTYRRCEAWGTDKRLVLRGMLDEYCPDKAVMVGDRGYDMEAASYNHIPFIGCLYGYAPNEIAMADCCVNDAYALYDAVMSQL